MDTKVKKKIERTQIMSLSHENELNTVAIPFQVQISVTSA